MSDSEQLPVVRITVESSCIGVGKSTIGSVIYHALKRMGYDVMLNPIPFPKCEQDRGVRQEIENVTGPAGKNLLDDPEFSHPKGQVLLNVHG